MNCKNTVETHLPKTCSKPVSASDVLIELIKVLQLQTATFKFISHHVSINWRVKYSTINEKLVHISEGLEQTEPLGYWHIKGYRVANEIEKISEIVRNNNQVLSVCSQIEINKKERHLYLMNLHPENDFTADELINLIPLVTNQTPGFLLLSGRHFHFYGIKLLDKRSWEKMLAQFLMPTILVSPRYIGHSLYRGYTSLRLTALAPYKPLIPRVMNPTII